MKVETAFEFLKRGHESGRLAHGYILEGSLRGVAGELANRCLELLYCGAENKPCGACNGCRQARAHTHPDVLWIEPRMKSRVISIEQIRELQHRISQTSYAGGWKSCVLAGGDRMGLEAANAFLKTLEEPPGQSVFFLLTDAPQRMIPTIISRCQRISLEGDGALLPEDVREVLGTLLSSGAESMSKGARKGSASSIVAFGRAFEIVQFLKAKKTQLEEEETELAEQEALDEDSKTIEARASTRYREFRTNVMRFILSWYRDLLVLASGCDVSRILNDKWLDALSLSAQGLSGRHAVECVQVVEEMNRRLERNLPEGAVFDLGFRTLAGR